MRTAITAPTKAGDAQPAGLAWISTGEFRMGSDGFYPEERPARRVAVDGFWTATRPVTVADFHRFVTVTGYRTVAEEPHSAANDPDAETDLLVPGSLVIRRAAGASPAGVVAEPGRDLWEAVDSCAGHIGFRCVIRSGPLLLPSAGPHELNPGRPYPRPAHGPNPGGPDLRR